MDTETVAAVIRWSGVIVALAGAVLTSPDGVKRIYDGFVLAIKKLFGRTPKDVNIDVPHAKFGSGSDLGTSEIPMWGPDAPLEERIEILLSRIEGLSAKLAEAKTELTERLDRHDKKIANLTTTLHKARQELHDLILAKEEKSAQIDAFGLPVIGLGIFLVGVPGDLAAVPWLGVSLTYLSLYVTLIVALLGIRRGAWSGKLS